jgi:peptidase A4-like protein
MVYTLVKKYRLPLALAMATIALAMQSSFGVSPAFARGITVSVPVNAASAATCNIYCPCHPGPGVSCNWAGKYAHGARGTYRKVSATFKVPTFHGINSPNSQITFWVGVGGVGKYAGTCTNCMELVQAGITSTVTATGGETTFAWYEVVASKGNINQTKVPIPGGLHHGDKIAVTVSSNYDNKGVDKFYIKDVTTNKHPVHYPISFKGHFSDSATGECIGERPLHTNGASFFFEPIPNFATEWMNDCSISSNNATHPVGSWPTNSVTMKNASYRVLVSVGGIDPHGSFPLYWKQDQ